MALKVPLGWTLAVQGHEEVKRAFDDIKRSMQDGSKDATTLAKDYRELQSATRIMIQQQTLSNRVYLATHPNIMKLSKAMSAFSSIMRTGLAISNALNLSKIASNGVNASLIEKENAVAEAQRKVNELIAAGKEGTDEYQTAVEDLAEKQADYEEALQKLKDADFSSLVTSAESAILAVTSVFNLLIKNETIRNALSSAGSWFGKIFGNTFTWIAGKIIAGLSWINNALFGGSLGSSLSTGGGALGRLLATSFLSAASGIITGVALSQIFFDPIDKWFKENVQGWEEFAKKRDEDSKKNAEAIFGKDSETAKNWGDWIPFGPKNMADTDVSSGGGGSVEAIINVFQPLIDLFQKGIPEAYGETETRLQQPLTIPEQADQTSIFQPLIDLFTITIPEAYESAKSAFTQVWITDIPTILTEASSVISGGFNNLWNGVIGATNFAGQSMTEGLNTIFSALIAHMNSVIAAYNRAAKKLGKPTIEPITFTPATFTPLESIPAIAAATGFSGTVSKPTLFLAGEAGAESVEITPNASRRGGGSSNQTIIVNVNGSILAEKELLKMVDNHQKSNLKRRGFTGI